MSIDPTTQIATWDPGNGVAMQTAYQGLPAPLQSDYAQALAQQYSQAAPPMNLNYQAMAPGAAEAQAAAMAQQAAADSAPFQATGGGVPMSRPMPAAPQGGGFSLDVDGQTGGAGVPAARTVRERKVDAAAPDAPAPGSPAAQAADTSTQWADPSAPQSAPSAQQQAGGFGPDDQLEAWGGLSLNQMRQIYRTNPNARIGGEAGTATTVSGPTQRQFRDPSPGMAGAVAAAQEARRTAAENQRLELDPILADADAITAERAAQAQAEDQFNAARAATQARRQEAIAAGRAKYDELAAQHIAAEQRGIDPDHYFASKSTGQRIMSAIGMMLGGVSAGLTGRENPAVGIINDAIDRDMVAQRENLAAKGRAAERQRGVLADVAALYDDEQTQNDAARLSLMRAAQQRIDKIASITAGTEARARLTGLSDAVAIEIADMDVALNDSIANTVTTSERPGVVGGRAGIRVSDIIKANPEGAGGLQSYGAADEHNPGELFVPAYQGNAPTKVEAASMRELAYTTRTYTSLMEKLIKFRSSMGNMTDPQRRAAAQAIAAEATLVKKGDALAKLGVLAGPDMDIINAAQGGDPTAMMAFDTARYRQAIENVRAAEDERVREMIIPVDPATIPDALRRQSRQTVRAAAGAVRAVE